jgi:hypothetical protein
MRTPASDAISPDSREWNDLVDWIVSIGFKRDHVESNLLDNSALQEWVRVILITGDSQEYGPQYSINRLRSGDFCFLVH